MNDGCYPETTTPQEIKNRIRIDKQNTGTLRRKRYETVSALSSVRDREEPL